MKRELGATGIALLLMLQTGCSTSEMMPFASKKNDADDPLAHLPVEAADTYKSARKSLDKGEATLLKFARWREEMGDHTEAKVQYSNILAENEDCIEARLGIARVEYATGRVAEAVEILQATAKQDPDHAPTWAELGTIQADREEWGQAVQSLTKAADLDQKNQSIRYQLGIALARSERYQEAKPHLAFAVGESAALYNIGYVLHEAKRHDEAALWMRRALNAHPDQRTRSAATRLLAQLGSDTPANQVRQPNQVNVALTSFEAYREVPGQNPESMASIQPATRSSTAAYPDTASPEAPTTQYAATNEPGVATVPTISSYSSNPNPQVQQWTGPSGTAPGTHNSAPSQTVQPPQWTGPGR